MTVALHRILADSSSGSHDTRLIVATLVAIAVIIALISWLKVHPFLALTIGSLIVGALSGWA